MLTWENNPNTFATVSSFEWRPVMSKFSIFCGMLFSATTVFSAAGYALSYEDSLQKGEVLFKQATRNRDVNERLLNDLKKQADGMISKYQGLSTQEAICKVKLGTAIKSEVEFSDDYILEDTKKYLKPNIEVIRENVRFLVLLRDKAVVADIEQNGGAELLKQREKDIEHSLWSLEQLQFSAVPGNVDIHIEKMEQKLGCQFDG